MNFPLAVSSFSAQLFVGLHLENNEGNNNKNNCNNNR